MWWFALFFVRVDGSLVAVVLVFVVVLVVVFCG